jgi:hypothetical protein
MYTGQLEQLARQRIAELSVQSRAVQSRAVQSPAVRTRAVRTRAARTGTTRTPEGTGQPRSLRTSTGWAIVAVGLRIAESGSR